MKGRTFYMQAESYGEKESWIGALGKAMIKQSVLIDDEEEDQYMWGRRGEAWARKRRVNERVNHLVLESYSIVESS